MGEMAIRVAFLCCLTLIFNSVAGHAPCEDECQDGNYQTVMLSAHHGVRGFLHFANTNITTFLGIPYARPPIDNLRFSQALPASWTGVRDALTLAPACLQSSDVTESESEDCLYLNVFTPDTDGYLPVMVWIHGGGFTSGSGMFWDGTQLASHDVVVVTINYRLGPLGFASTGDNVMPGNFGMLDQVLALKWVNENIGAFGADASQVTLFGNSAGSTSISLHILSPLSVGLLHRAIVQSGSVYSLWGHERYMSFPTPKDAIRDIGRALRCPELNNSRLLLECLRHTTGHAIIKEANRLSSETQTSIIFMPRVENTFGFLPEHPEVLIEHGRFQNIEIITGFTSGEASENVYNIFPHADGISRDQFIYGLLGIFTWSSFQDELEIAESFADYYLENVTDSGDILSRLYDAANDIFKIPILIQLRKFLSHQTTPKPLRLYQFDYMPTALGLPEYIGLPHSAERGLLFHSSANTSIFIGDTYHPLILSREDIMVARKIQTMWTDFAKSGKPLEVGTEHHWPAYTLDAPIMLHINRQLSLSPIPKLTMSRHTKQKTVEIYQGFLKFLKNNKRFCITRPV